MSDVFKEWLLSALMDLRSIEKMMNDKFLTPIVCFHSQQCIEKSLKAVLEKNNMEVPKTHDVVRLYGMIQNTHNLQLDFDLLTKVGELYIESRYPGDFGLLPDGKPTLEDAQEFYRFARGVYETVTLILEGNVER